MTGDARFQMRHLPCGRGHAGTFLLQVKLHYVFESCESDNMSTSAELHMSTMLSGLNGLSGRTRNIKTKNRGKHTTYFGGAHDAHL